jgi:hypothetical protein
MASGVMIYGGFVYLPKTVMNAAYMCSSTYIWVDSGDFKDCLYIAIFQALYIELSF